MGANRLTTGNTVPYTPVADVAAGDMIKFGTAVGVAENDILTGEVGALAVTGVFRVPTDSLGGTPSLGDELDVDLTDMTVVDAGAGDASVKVFVADDYSSVPANIDVWINKVG